MNIFEKLKAKTPRKNKNRGQLLTTISIICGAVLTAGVVTAPIGIALLTVGAVIGGSGALYHGSKVQR